MTQSNAWEGPATEGQLITIKNYLSKRDDFDLESTYKHFSKREAGWAIDRIKAETDARRACGMTQLILKAGYEKGMTVNQRTKIICLLKEKNIQGKERKALFEQFGVKYLDQFNLGRASTVIQHLENLAERGEMEVAA